mgnify:CR=1 FL=1
MLEEKLRECFDEMTVFKDLKKTNAFNALSLPSFLRDWLLKKFEDENGNYDMGEVQAFVRQYLPPKDDWNSIKSRLVTGGERVKILTKIMVDIDIRTQQITFSLPGYDLKNKETLITPYIWEKYQEQLLRGRGSWGVVEMDYLPPDEDNKEEGQIRLVSFTDFCPYTVDLDFFKDVRNEFNVHEWIDILLGAIDYNADGYASEHEKLSVLKRLLPFVEKRLNLIELAPKGTGKSYLFGRVSRFGWLSSGGTMTRAKMFYDISKHEPGLVSNNDYVALDEIQTITFPNPEEMRGALKGYMESGEYTVGNYAGIADAGVILLGNISQNKMDEYQNMFVELPKVFQESALLDRFHGFIKGWDIPRMNDDLKIHGWALNSEYFSSIMHLLRDDGTYRAMVDDIVEVPPKSDTRDTEAVKRLATAYLKLLFPNVTSTGDIDKKAFRDYCLRPAMQMRGIIKTQLGIMDEEFKGKSIPNFTLRDNGI